MSDKDARSTSRSFIGGAFSFLAKITFEGFPNVDVLISRWLMCGSTRSRGATTRWPEGERLHNLWVFTTATCIQIRQNRIASQIQFFLWISCFEWIKRWRKWKREKERREMRKRKRRRRWSYYFKGCKFRSKWDNITMESIQNFCTFHLWKQLLSKSIPDSV